VFVIVAGSESSWITKTEAKQQLGFFVFATQLGKLVCPCWGEKSKRF